MSKRLKIPPSAELMSVIHGTINTGPRKGKPALIKVYKGWYSKGYKSNYERVKTFYVETWIDDQRNAWSYSGKNIAEMERDLQHARSLIDEVK